MPTIEEEKARGEEISTLYPTPKPASALGPHFEHTKPSDLGMVTKQGFILGVVTAVVCVLIALFLRLTFDPTGKIQQWGVFVMPLGLVIGVLIIFSFRAVYRQLDKAVMYSISVFWTGVTAAAGSATLLYIVLLSGPRPSLDTWIIKTAIASIGIVIVTTAVMWIVARALERTKPTY